MRTFGLYLLNIALLVVLASCGKDNESGKASNFMYGSGYGNINSAYSYGGVSVNAVIAANPCMTGFGPNARAMIQLPAPFTNTIIQNGDVYVGVTSSGDVGVIVGNGTPNATFVAYLCQRGAVTAAQPYLVNRPTIGTTTGCSFKPIASATLVIPGFNAPIPFRQLDFGNSQGVKFPSPICL